MASVADRGGVAMRGLGRAGEARDPSPRPRAAVNGGSAVRGRDPRQAGGAKAATGSSTQPKTVEKPGGCVVGAAGIEPA